MVREDQGLGGGRYRNDAATSQSRANQLSRLGAIVEKIKGHEAISVEMGICRRDKALVWLVVD